MGVVIDQGPLSDGWTREKTSRVALIGETITLRISGSSVVTPNDIIAIADGRMEVSFSETPPADPPIPPECSDGVDNDGDTFIDWPDDLECASAADDSESPPECSDAIDNDGDGLTDWPADPGCSQSDDESELNEPIPPVPALTPIGITALLAALGLGLARAATKRRR